MGLRCPLHQAMRVPAGSGDGIASGNRHFSSLPWSPLEFPSFGRERRRGAGHTPVGGDSDRSRGTLARSILHLSAGGRPRRTPVADTRDGCCPACNDDRRTRTLRKGCDSTRVTGRAHWQLGTHCAGRRSWHAECKSTFHGFADVTEGSWGGSCPPSLRSDAMAASPSLQGSRAV